MKKLEITKGLWDAVPDSLEGDNQSYYIIAKNEKSDYWGKWIAEAKYPELYKGSIQQTKDNAALMADAGNTYQVCELLPSELLKQNKELREALESAAHQLHTGYETEALRILNEALNTNP